MSVGYLKDFSRISVEFRGHNACLCYNLEGRNVTVKMKLNIFSTGNIEEGFQVDLNKISKGSK